MIICEDCVKVFDGTRSEARHAGWEPDSFRSQWHVDHGPMTCPDCVLRLLGDILEALKRGPRGRAASGRE